MISKWSQGYIQCVQSQWSKYSMVNIHLLFLVLIIGATCNSRWYNI